MPKAEAPLITKFVVTAHCRSKNRAGIMITHFMGDLIDLDLNNKHDCDVCSLLSREGRIVLAEPEVVESIRKDAARQAAHEDAAAHSAGLMARERAIALQEKELDLEERTRVLAEKKAKRPRA